MFVSELIGCLPSWIHILVLIGIFSLLQGRLAWVLVCKKTDEQPKEKKLKWREWWRNTAVGLVMIGIVGVGIRLGGTEKGKMLVLIFYFYILTAMFLFCFAVVYILHLLGLNNDEEGKSAGHNVKKK